MKEQTQIKAASQATANAIRLWLHVAVVGVVTAAAAAVVAVIVAVSTADNYANSKYCN